MLQSDWFVILNWRLMVMLIQSFLNTSTRLIYVLQSLVYHVCASFGGFFRWLIHSFVGDWCYNLIGSFSIRIDVIAGDSGSFFIRRDVIVGDNGSFFIIKSNVIAGDSGYFFIIRRNVISGDSGYFFIIKRNVIAGESGFFCIIRSRSYSYEGKEEKVVNNYFGSCVYIKISLVDRLVMFE